MRSAAPAARHLHLDIPAIGHLAHAEALETVAANRAIGAHIGVADAIERSDAEPRQMPGETLHARSSNPAPAPRACARR